MKTRYITSIVWTVIAAATFVFSATALASDSKSLPGSICRAKYDYDHYVYGYGYIGNNNPYNEMYVYCPMVREVMASGSKAWNWIYVRSCNRSGTTSRDIECWACSTTETGNSWSCVGDVDVWYFDYCDYMDFSSWTPSRYPNGTFFVYCKLPRVVYGEDRSQILNINWDEP